MAALQKIRGKSGLLVIVIGVALLAFILNDFFSSGSRLFSRFKDNVFSVNGKIVSRSEFQSKVHEFEDFQKIISGNQSLSEQVSSRIPSAVYHQAATQMMLDDQTQKLGLTISKPEMNDLVYGNNISPILYSFPYFINSETGRFDPAQVKEFLEFVAKPIERIPMASRQEYLVLNQAWQFLEKQVKYIALEQKYTGLLSRAIIVNNAEINAAKEDQKSSADISYVCQDYASLADSAFHVSNTELAALYQKRKNNFVLHSPLTRVSYFIKDVYPSESDYAEVASRMEEAHKKLISTTSPFSVVTEYSSVDQTNAGNMFVSVSSLDQDMKTFLKKAAVGDINGPVRGNQYFEMTKLVAKKMDADSVHLQYYPMANGFNQNTINQKLDSLKKVVRTTDDFAKIVNKAYPKIKGTKSDGGDFGWFTSQSLVNTLKVSNPDLFFNNKVGDMFLTSVAGANVIFRVAGKSKPVEKVKLATVKMFVPVGDKTLNTIETNIDQFMAKSGNLKDFDKGAISAGYSVQSNVLLSSDMPLFNGIPSSRNVIQWAFNAKPGQIKNFNLNDKRVVAIVKEHVTGNYLPMSEVANQLRSEIIRDKKADKIIADLKAKKLQGLNDYAKAVSGKVDSVKFVSFETNQLQNLGFEPIFNVAAKHGVVNKLSQPEKGLNGVYVYSVTKKEDTSKAFDAKLYSTQTNQLYQYLMMGNGNQQMSPVIMALWDKLNVKENLAKMYE